MNRILLVEDEIIIAESLRLFLKKNSYEATIATNGEKAIQNLKDLAFDGVICDINLQEKMNGIEIIQQFHDLENMGLLSSSRLTQTRRSWKTQKP
ncbi:response regulator [Salinimicrobium sp. HB62]|uniref:response regulator n=1 Tax=Salinimicrobium sp. HB62 TaxID=3077781 RepID=UPI002D79E29A|nr:response regulator [Salinimicrobium sp. HB62]